MLTGDLPRTPVPDYDSDSDRFRRSRSRSQRSVNFRNWSRSRVFWIKFFGVGVEIIITSEKVLLFQKSTNFFLHAVLYSMCAQLVILLIFWAIQSFVRCYESYWTLWRPHLSLTFGDTPSGKMVAKTQPNIDTTWSDRCWYRVYKSRVKPIDEFFFI